MFTRKDRDFVDSILSKLSNKGEKGGATVNKGAAKLIRIIIIGIGLLFIGSIVFIWSFLNSSVTKKSK